MRPVHSTDAGPAPRTQRPAARWWAWAAVATLAGLGLWSLWFQLGLAGRLPEAEGWTAVADRLSAEARPGDAVLGVPDWATELRTRLDPALPVLAWAPDDPELGRAGQRLWVVALPSAPRAHVRRALATLEARFGPPAVKTEVGPVRLARFDGLPGPPAWRLVDHVTEAEVRLGGRRCAYRPRHRGGPRFQCPRGPWNYVAAQTREVDYQARRCVWAHPADGAPLVVTVPSVPFQGRLALRAGLVGEPALEARAPVTVAVRADEAALGTVTVAPRPGWQAFSLPAPSGPQALTLEVTTPDATRRTLCLDAWVEADG